MPLLMDRLRKKSASHILPVAVLCYNNDNCSYLIREGLHLMNLEQHILKGKYLTTEQWFFGQQARCWNLKLWLKRFFPLCKKEEISFTLCCHSTNGFHTHTHTCLGILNALFIWQVFEFHRILLEPACLTNCVSQSWLGRRISKHHLWPFPSLLIVPFFRTIKLPCPAPSPVVASK